jgi:hypothetical protein
MNEISTLNQRYETIAWGTFFVLLGVLFFVPGGHAQVQPPNPS